MTGVRLRLIAFIQFFLLAILVSGCSSFGDAMRASPALANALGVADMPMADLEKRYTTKESHFVDVNGYKIHYRDTGEGPTLVLLHGVMSSLQTWDAWIGELNKTNRVIAIDVPGFGLTGGPANLDDFSEANIINTFTKFVDEIELDHFSIVGNSLGGYVGAMYAAENPERVDRLILLDPVGYPQDIPWIMKLATTPGFSHLGLVFQPPVVITLNVRDVYGDPRRMEKDNVYRYVHMAQRPGARKVYLKTMQILKETSQHERPLPFHQIKAPTLVMWGEEDHWVPMKLSQRWLAAIPNSQLVTYPGVGHMPMEEIPYTSLADAMLFLEGKKIPTKAEREAAAEPPPPAPLSNGLEPVQ